VKAGARDLSRKTQSKEGQDATVAHVESGSTTAQADVDPELLKSLVEDRVKMIRPAITAQAVAALQSDTNMHDPRGLISDDEVLLRNFANHGGFHIPLPASSMPMRDMQRLQRGVGTSSSRPRAAQDGNNMMHADVQTELVGKWEAMTDTGNIDANALDEVLQAYRELLSVCQLSEVAPVEHKSAVNKSSTRSVRRKLCTACLRGKSLPPAPVSPSLAPPRPPASSSISRFSQTEWEEVDRPCVSPRLACRHFLRGLSARGSQCGFGHW
jgi:hypothetical protein